MTHKVERFQNSNPVAVSYTTTVAGETVDSDDGVGLSSHTSPQPQ